MSSRKIYSRDFKLKVLEYYFKHGGDKKFGLKTKTANHFCIDHKTVSRMLCNAEIVKKARRTLAKKNSSGTSCKPPKPPSLKLMGQPFGGIKDVGMGANSSDGTPTPSSSKSFSPEQCNMASEERKQSKHISEVPVIELPEDPDFSLLKKTIESPVSAAANFARLLITGTKEVKRILSNECDLIFECKVCRNLFRSIINFLAHKRVYCQEENVNVRSLFHQDSGRNMSSESSTIVVEPEPPPLDPMEDPERNELKIDRIASKLARQKRRSEAESKLSSSTDTGSSGYFNKLEQVNEHRKSMSSDCSVLLQDIAGVSSAVYQTFIPPNSSQCTKERTRDIIREVHQRKRREPVQLDAEGKVLKRNESCLISPSKISLTKEVEQSKEEVFQCSSCSCSFSSKKLLDAHIADIHGIERTVYTCPICNMVFLSIWGCVKHLIRTHKKKKHQRERLKHVICSRAYTKLFTTKDIAKQVHKNPEQVQKLPETTPDTPAEAKEVVTRVGLVEEEPPTPVRNKVTVISQSCPRCGQTFQTPTAMGSHLQYCPLASLQNTLQSGTPEKKIAIQIRKDYKKETSGPPLLNIPEKVTPENKFSKEIENRIREICVLNRLYCKPCKRRYNTITVLKRHAAHHLGWTRFSCSRCPFRSYEKYVCSHHCITIHRASVKNVDMMILKDDKLGKFKYHLSSSSSMSDNIPLKSEQEDTLGKSDYIQNGGYSSSSECSASVVSEDSISFKSEIENQDLESANVAYRELIENVDIAVESSSSTDTRCIEEKSEPDMKLERPQRTRRTIEQKDFVYESLRPTSSLSRSDDESKIITRLSSHSSGVESPFPQKRKSVSVSREPLKKRVHSRFSLLNQATALKICNGTESASVDKNIQFKDSPKSLSWLASQVTVKKEIELESNNEGNKKSIDVESQEGITPLEGKPRDYDNRASIKKSSSTEEMKSIGIKTSPDVQKSAESKSCGENKDFMETKLLEDGPKSVKEVLSDGLKIKQYGENEPNLKKRDDKEDCSSLKENENSEDYLKSLKSECKLDIKKSETEEATEDCTKSLIKGKVVTLNISNKESFLVKRLVPKDGVRESNENVKKCENMDIAEIKDSSSENLKNDESGKS